MICNILYKQLVLDANYALNTGGCGYKVIVMAAFEVLSGEGLSTHGDEASVSSSSIEEKR